MERSTQLAAVGKGIEKRCLDPVPTAPGTLHAERKLVAKDVSIRPSEHCLVPVPVLDEERRVSCCGAAEVVLKRYNFYDHRKEGFHPADGWCLEGWNPPCSVSEHVQELCIFTVHTLATVCHSRLKRSVGTYWRLEDWGWRASKEQHHMGLATVLGCFQIYLMQVYRRRRVVVLINGIWIGNGATINPFTTLSFPLSNREKTPDGGSYGRGKEWTG